MLTVKRSTRFPEGSGLVGMIRADYKTLCEVFGKEHSDGDGYKIDAHWDLEFSDGTVATIYNYKDGKNYLGAEGKAKQNITEWHVGGYGDEAYTLVTRFLSGY